MLGALTVEWVCSVGFRKLGSNGSSVVSSSHLVDIKVVDYGIKAGIKVIKKCHHLTGWESRGSESCAQVPNNSQAEKQKEL